MPAQPAGFPLILIPIIVAFGLALSPRFMLRMLGSFIALNLPPVACFLAAETTRPTPLVQRPSPTGGDRDRGDAKPSPGSRAPRARRRPRRGRPRPFMVSY